MANKQEGGKLRYWRPARRHGRLPAIAASLTLLLALSSSETRSLEKQGAGPAPHSSPVRLAQVLDRPVPTPAPTPERLAPPAPKPGDTSIVGYAFAKASPLLVFDTAAMTEGRRQDFEFGRAHEATENSAEYMKIKLADGRQVYVRSAHVTAMRFPRWVTGTTALQKAERARVRLWESTVRLNEFLAGINPSASRWDYEEYFDAAPAFQLTLPVTESDTLDLLGGARQVKVMSVMLPISKEMYQAFEDAKAKAEKELDVHFLVDVSGSTKDFLAPVIAGLTKALGRNEALRKRISSMTVTTFGASRSEKSMPLGQVTLQTLDKVTWHKAGVDQTTNGEREPLIDGFVSLSRLIKPESTAAPIFIVLSGADVELSSYIAALGKTVEIENLDLKLPGPGEAIFAQVTPEPGPDLRSASGRLRNMSRSRYLDYSDTLGEDVIAELGKLADGLKATVIPPEAFSGVSKVAHAKNMMAFLPRTLTPTSSLPARQSYAAQADWYSIRLWLTLDGLIWKETAQ